MFAAKLWHDLLLKHFRRPVVGDFDQTNTGASQGFAFDSVPYERVFMIVTTALNLNGNGQKPKAVNDSQIKTFGIY